MAMRTGEAVGRQVMPQVVGVTFRCHCGCNVFTEIGSFKYRCNSCQSMFAGEPAGSKPIVTEKEQTVTEAQKKIESLTFYGCGDEAYELFAETCHLAYSMTGLGYDSNAYLLALWAEEMAADSVNYLPEDEDPGTTKDKRKGVWG